MPTDTEQVIARVDEWLRLGPEGASVPSRADLIALLTLARQYTGEGDGLDEVIAAGDRLATVGDDKLAWRSEWLGALNDWRTLIERLRGIGRGR